MRANTFRLFLCCLLTWGALAQQHPNIAKGFQPDKVYQFGGVDNVNLYNGSLSLTIPIGPQYKGNGALEYQFVLVYNNKAWDQITTSYNCVEPPASTDACNTMWANIPYVMSIPSRSSNAGMGWQLTLGRLYAPGDPVLDPGSIGGGPPQWTYESPDGARHAFGPFGEADQYTTDGSFLRMKDSGTTQEVDFLDGMKHTFGVGGFHGLKRIEDPFGNHLDAACGLGGVCTFIEYDHNGTSIRTHTITEGPPDVMPAHVGNWMNYNTVIKRVDLAAFNGQTAGYEFTYETDTLPYGCYGDFRPPETYNSLPATPDTPIYSGTEPFIGPSVPRLKEVKLPDLSTWRFEYDNSESHSLCSSLSKLTFPTHGEMEWEYGAWGMPTSGCVPLEVMPDAPDIPGQYSNVEGVVTKRVKPDGDTNVMTWTYQQVADFAGDPDSQVRCQAAGPEPTEHANKDRQSVVTVTNPDGTYSKNYFSIWNFADPEDIGTYFHNSEYGLPFTRAVGSEGGRCDNVAHSSALCLSREEFDASVPPQLKKSIYVGYDGEQRYVAPDDPQYRRERDSLTVFHEEAEPDHSVRVERSHYDGLGHYRTVTTADSWSGLDRDETTSYNPTKQEIIIDRVQWTNTPAPDTNRPPTGAKWLLNLFGSKETTEHAKTFKSEFCFDAESGFLTHKRDFQNTQPIPPATTLERSGEDALAVFGKDDLGNLTSESYSGGDGANLSTATTCTLNPTPQFKLIHSYQFGTRSRSAYVDGSGQETLRVLDATIDDGTGLPESTGDSADVQTTYGYDLVGRITSIKPTGQGWTEYGYDVGTTTPGVPNTDPPRAFAKVRAANTDSTGTPLTEQRYYYDGYGRLIQEKTMLPGSNRWAARNTEYDDKGRISKEYEPIETTSSSYESIPANSPGTELSYDSVGRLAQSTAADGSVTSFDYAGVRERTTTSQVATPTDPNADRTTTEIRDGVGRVVEVKQPTGPTTSTAWTGANVTTSYGYDAANHLISVKMTGPETVQSRIFDYDGRGFLRWESHPESGMSAYEYDALGHVINKTQGAAQSPYDLSYVYDRAERVTSVLGRNPLYDPGDSNQPAFRVMKEFTYGTQNGTAPACGSVPIDPATDLRKGKLQTAIRYNYFDNSALQTFVVTETYRYQDDAGRQTGRCTGIGDTASIYENVDTSFSYTDLGHFDQVRYPRCIGCGLPPNPDRTLTSTYDRGLLKGLSDGITSFVADMTYHPNGLWSTISHSNGITDTQLLDPDGMARPREIKFETYGRCTAPAFVTQPVGGTLSGGTFTLSVQVSGTAPFRYQWWRADSWIPISGATSSSYVATEPGEYYVTVANDCRSDDNAVESDYANVANACQTPAVSLATPIRHGDGSYTLSADQVEARAGATFTWRKSPDNTQVGSTRTITVTPPTTPTTYTLTVHDSCGDASASTSLPIATPLPLVGGVAATANPAGTRVDVSWLPSAGATHYEIQRRSGPTWDQSHVVAAPSLTYANTTNVVPGQTYVYRVRALLIENGVQTNTSPWSSSDVATTISFTPVQSGDPVSAAPLTEILTAVNAARATVGWPTVAWSTILSSSNPIPTTGNLVSSSHILAARARLSEALQAVGVIVAPFTDPDLQGAPIKVVHINEIFDRLR